MSGHRTLSRACLPDDTLSCPEDDGSGNDEVVDIRYVVINTLDVAINTLYDTMFLEFLVLRGSGNNCTDNICTSIATVYFPKSFQTGT